jgi:hypothetical protein
MEIDLTFFVKGKFVNITREEGEIKSHFDLRVDFITSRVGKYDDKLLTTYSKVYADKMIYGVTYQRQIEDKLDELRGIVRGSNAEDFEDFGEGVEEEKRDDEIERQEEEIEEVREILEQGPVVMEADTSSLKFDENILVTPIGDAAFLDIEGNRQSEMIFQTVESVEMAPSSEEGKTEGLVLFVNSDSDETIQVKSCSDSTCSEPSPVLVSDPLSESVVIIEPRPVSEVEGGVEGMAEDENQGGVEDVTEDAEVEETKKSPKVKTRIVGEEEDVAKEVFGDPEARNAFLLPDVDCYTSNVKSDNTEHREAVMETCIRERFASDTMSIKLKSTKGKKLVYEPDDEVTEPWRSFWKERYPRLLTKVRDELLSGAAFSSEASSKEATGEDIESVTKSPKGGVVEGQKDETMKEAEGGVVEGQKDETIVTEKEEKREAMTIADICKKESFDMQRLEKVRREAIVDGDVKFDSNPKAIFDVYDRDYFGGAFGSSDLRFEVNWIESNVAGDLIISEDSKSFTLNLSKMIFATAVGGTIFGVECTTAMQCVRTYVESFMATTLYEVCQPQEGPEDFVRKLFGHTSTEVSFRNRPLRPSNSALRDRLLKMKEDPETVVHVTVEGLGVKELISARSKDTITLGDVDDADRLQPYEKITHVEGVPV